MAFSSKKLSLFYTQMGTMIKAGVPIQQSLGTVCRTVPSSMRKAIGQITETVNRGEPLHVAMAALPKSFAPLDYQTLKISEQSGALDTGLLSLANYYEQRARAKMKILTGLIIPGLLLVAAVLVPKLPNLILGLLGLREYSLLDYALDTLKVASPILLAPVAVAYVIRCLLRVPGVNVPLDRLVNAIPAFGRFRFDYALSQWTQSLRLMLRAGFGVIEALEFACESSSSPTIAASHARMKPLLNSELNVSQALAMTGVFPPMVIQLWATGEQSGKMDEMLDGLVRNFEAQWQQSLRILSVVLPIVIYFLIGIYLITQIFGMFGEYINGINTAIDGGM